MILQAPTPYVPQRQITFPTPQTNFHLRVPNKRIKARRGMGDTCQSGPYGSIAAGPLCLDVDTGSPVLCSSSICSNSPNPVSGTPTPVSGGTSVLGPAPAGPSMVGCGSADVEAYIYQTAASLIAFPSSGGGVDPVTILTNAANQSCQESGAGGQFGCPPMQGCDQASISALVAKYAAMVAPAYNQYQTSGAYAPSSSPGFTPVPPNYGSPTFSANGTAIATQPPPTAPLGTQSNAPNQTPVGSGAVQSNAVNQTAVLPALPALPTWAWYALGGVAALVVIGMVVKK